MTRAIDPRPRCAVCGKSEGSHQMFTRFCPPFEKSGTKYTKPGPQIRLAKI